MLASGHSLADIVSSLGHVAEGVQCARTVALRARHLGVDMPITDSVVSLLDGSASPPEVVKRLMGRGPKAEGLV
jgi:glycerol-3-phosphate dehydrogenase (NAD(P)+)